MILITLLQTPVIATPAGELLQEILADRFGCVLAKAFWMGLLQAMSYWISRHLPIGRDAVAVFDALHQLIHVMVDCRTLKYCSIVALTGRETDIRGWHGHC